MARSIAYNLVGNAFEQQLLDSFPSWRRIPNGNNKPDFDCGDFYVEAKGSYIENGGQPKWYQFKNFSSLDNPTLYAFGYHAMYGIMALEKQMPQNKLIPFVMKRLDFNPVYFVNAQVVRAIMHAEVLVSKKKQQQYFCIKPRCLDRIIDGGQIVRGNVTTTAHERYHVRPTDYVLVSPQQNLRGVRQKTGFILHKKQDEAAIDFFGL